MKLPCLTIVAVMLIAGPANAIGIADLARIQADKLSSMLSLSEKQTAEVSELIRAQILKLQVSEDMSSDNRREMMAEIRSIETDTRESIRGVLDDNQAQMLAEMRGSILPQPRMLNLNEHLDLNESQYIAIDSILTSYRERMEPRSEDRREMREQMRKMNDEITELLTDEQKQKYEKLMDARRDEMRDQSGRRDRGGGSRRW